MEKSTVFKISFDDPNLSIKGVDTIEQMAYNVVVESMRDINLLTSDIIYHIDPSGKIISTNKDLFRSSKENYKMEDIEKLIKFANIIYISGVLFIGGEYMHDKLKADVIDSDLSSLMDDNNNFIIRCAPFIYYPEKKILKFLFYNTHIIGRYGIDDGIISKDDLIKMINTGLIQYIKIQLWTGNKRNKTPITAVAFNKNGNCWTGSSTLDMAEIQS